MACGDGDVAGDLISHGPHAQATVPRHAASRAALSPEPILSGLEIAVNRVGRTTPRGRMECSSHPLRACRSQRQAVWQLLRGAAPRRSARPENPGPSPGPLKRNSPGLAAGSQVRHRYRTTTPPPRLPKPRTTPGRVHPDPDCRARARAESARGHYEASQPTTEAGPEPETLPHPHCRFGAGNSPLIVRSAPAPYLPVLRVTVHDSAVGCPACFFMPAGVGGCHQAWWYGRGNDLPQLSPRRGTLVGDVDNEAPVRPARCACAGSRTPRQGRCPCRGKL